MRKYLEVLFATGLERGVKLYNVFLFPFGDAEDLGLYIAFKRLLDGDFGDATFLCAMPRVGVEAMNYAIICMFISSRFFL